MRALFDSLRPPPPSDPTARAYKDWLHLNVFDPRQDVTALVNVSLHGPPEDRRARAVGVALAHLGQGGWAGGIEIAGFREVSIGPQGILLGTVSLSVAPDQRAIHAAVRMAEDGLEADLVAEPLAAAFGFDLRSPFGGGWISWWAMPLLSVSGEIRSDGRRIALDGALGYHDHNWGRWFWGDDAAWEWGAFVLPEARTAIIFARACDRARRHYGPAFFCATTAERRIVFPPERVSVSFQGALGPVDRRVPGVLAAIHPDRLRPALPRSIEIVSAEGSNTLRLVVEGSSAAQLLLAEPTRPGYAYINEIAGVCSASGRIFGTEIAATGTGVFEYVE